MKDNDIIIRGRRTIGAKDNDTLLRGMWIKFIVALEIRFIISWLVIFLTAYNALGFENINNALIKYKQNVMQDIRRLTIKGLLG